MLLLILVTETSILPAYTPGAEETSLERTASEVHIVELSTRGVPLRPTGPARQSRLHSQGTVQSTQGVSKRHK